MTKRKITILGPVYPYRGGNALFVSHLYEKLKPRFDVDMLNYKLLYPSLLFPGKTQFDVSKAHYSTLPSQRMVNSIGPLSWLKTANYIKKTKPDLMVFDWWQPFFGPCHRAISSFIRKEYKGRILFMTENLLSHEARIVDKTLTKIGLKHADAFLAFSDIVVEGLNKLQPGKPVYKSSLPIFDWFKPEENQNVAALKKSMGFQPDDIVLLFFGYIRKYKGLDILLEAFAQMEKTNPKYKLLVAGEFYDNEENYRAIIDKHGIGDKIHMVNRFIPNEEVANYFEVSEVVVQPYRSATQSGILNIAQGYYKPVIATKVGGLSEFIDHEQTGILIEEATPEAVVRGVESYFKLKETVNFPANIKRKTEDIAFNTIDDLFEQILDDMVGKA